MFFEKIHQYRKQAFQLRGAGDEDVASRAGLHPPVLSHRGCGRRGDKQTLPLTANLKCKQQNAEEREEKNCGIQMMGVEGYRLFLL